MRAGEPTMSEDSVTIEPLKPIIPRFNPTGRHVLVKPDPTDEKVGVLFVPGTAQTEKNRGQVLRVGPEVHDAKVGDSVLFEKFAGTELIMDDQRCLLVLEDNIIAVIEEG